jgi:hypothetical protein
MMKEKPKQGSALGEILAFDAWMQEVRRELRLRLGFTVEQARKFATKEMWGDYYRHGYGPVTAVVISMVRAHADEPEDRDS